MISHSSSQPAESILADLKAHARQIDDDNLLRLIYRLQDALDCAPNQGKRTNVGNISGSTEVAIGRGAQAHVDQSHTMINVNLVFRTIQDRLAALFERVEAVTPEIVQDAQGEVEDLQPEVAKGDHADQGFLMRRFRNLARMGPNILDVVTASLLSPAPGIAKVVQLVAAKAREEAGLSAVG